MPEFPNATRRPWMRSGVVVQSVMLRRVFCVGPDSCAVAFLAGGPTDKEYVAARADADLIVHAVNTYETRELLLEEARQIISRIYINRERTGPDMAGSIAARAFLAKLESRDG